MTDNDKHEMEVGVTIPKETTKGVNNFIPVSPRVMLVPLKATPIDKILFKYILPRRMEQMKRLKNSTAISTK